MFVAFLAALSKCYKIYLERFQRTIKLASDCNDNVAFLYSPCSVKEFMDFTAKLLVERTQIGLRASVKEQGKISRTF